MRSTPWQRRRRTDARAGRAAARDASTGARGDERQARVGVGGRGRLRLSERAIDVMASPAPTARPPAPICSRRRWIGARRTTGTPRRIGSSWPAHVRRHPDDARGRRHCTRACWKCGGAAARTWRWSVLARGRPGARLGPALPHRRVHQSHARPPRLSRQHGHLRRGQGRLFYAAVARESVSTSTTRSGASSPTRGRGRVCDAWRVIGRRRCSCAPARHCRRAASSSSLDAWGDVQLESCRWSATSTSTTC